MDGGDKVTASARGGVPCTTWQVFCFVTLTITKEGGEGGGVLVLGRREACTNNTK